MNSSAQVRIAVMTNIANPYNAHLFDELRRRQQLAGVHYQGPPASAGRLWQIELGPDEHIGPGVRGGFRSARALRSAADAVVLSGSYHRVVDVARLAGLVGMTSPCLFWGERLRPGKAWVDAVRRAALRRFDALLCVGTWAVGSYRAVARADQPLHVLPYTTTIPRPAPRTLGRQPLFGFVGSLIPRKGLDVVLAALAQLPGDRRPDLEVVGSGPEGARWRAQAAAAGLRVAWLGELSQDAIDERRQRWWSQVVPSRYDGWGVVVSEAMAAGTPVLASGATGAAVDLVRDGFNGRIVRDDGWGEAVLHHCQIDHAVREGELAKEVGRQFSPELAAAFLCEVAADPQTPRDFVTEAWERVGALR